MGKVNETQMALAINAINNDGMDLRSAARTYGVKKSTLNDRLFLRKSDSEINENDEFCCNDCYCN